MTTQWPQRTPWPPPRQRVPRAAVVLIAVVLVLLVGLGVVVALTVLPGTAAASEVTREPVATAGANPFMPPVGSDATGVTAPPGAGGTYRADTAGLYGGSRDERTCDRQKLTRFLDSHRGQAAAWSGVLGIRTWDIDGYVAGLTPVLLRADTLVTNHGYLGGRATVLTSVLQAGTAVFVDRYGTPVVRCFCGNPLTAPTLYGSPTYVGPTWVSFDRTTITIVQSSPTVINNYALVDARAGRPFTRPGRSDGTRDGDPTYSPGPVGTGGPHGGPGGSGPASTVPDGGTSTGPGGRAPDTTDTPFDPENAEYTVSCGTARLRGGSGSAGGRPVELLAAPAADLTPDAGRETVALLQCTPRSGDPVQEVQVFGSDGRQIGTLPTPPAPPGSTRTPEFVPSTFALSGGTLRSAMKVFGPDDSTAPSLRQTWTWDWTGSSFSLEPGSVTPVPQGAAPQPAPESIPEVVPPAVPESVPDGGTGGSRSGTSSTPSTGDTSAERAPQGAAPAGTGG